MSDQLDLRSLAEAIVEEMYRNGQGEKATRLVLVDEHDRDLGGWGRKPFADRVEIILRKAKLGMTAG